VAEQSNEYAVQCRGVTKSFGSGEAEVKALRGVDLTVAVGELLMLVGPSGCGKTTLISIIASVLDHDTGDCEVLGRSLGKLSASEKTSLRRAEIGFVFQSYNLIPSLAVVENVAVPLLLNGLSRANALTRANEMLERLGLGGRGHNRPNDLSGGQQQRVAVARALVHHPRILVCDEPTSALDATTGDNLMRLLHDITLEDQRTLIVVTHDNRIFGYANRIAEMNDGRIVRMETEK
jgi:putative ABC transport system ATP-binding protein